MLLGNDELVQRSPTHRLVVSYPSNRPFLKSDAITGRVHQMLEFFGFRNGENAVVQFWFRRRFRQAGIKRVCEILVVVQWCSLYNVRSFSAKAIEIRALIPAIYSVVLLAHGVVLVELAR